MSARGPRGLGAAMLAPAVLYIVLVVGLPFLLSLVYAVTDVRVGSNELRFVGLENFSGLFASPSFRKALGNSILFTVASQLLVMGLATLLALGLQDAFRGRRLVRFLMLLPWVAPVSLGAFGWKWILDSLYSVVNWSLARMGWADPVEPPMWLGEPGLAMASVVAVQVWRMTPFATVILLAGLTSIPRDIPEAAQVDGAGFWRTHFEVTLPMIRPIVAVAALFGIIVTFTDMSVVYILTRGGPHDATQVLPSLAFQTGVLGGAISEGAAISLFLAPVLFGVAFLMLKVARKSEVV